MSGSLSAALVSALLSIASMSCASAHAPTIRFVTASPAELTLGGDSREIWYEVQEGDELPLVFLFSGVAQGLSDAPIVLKAQKTFYLVCRGNGSFRISFDGKTATENVGRVALTLIPGPPNNRAGIILYIGKPEDMEASLRALKDGGAGASASPEAAGEDDAADATPAAEPRE